MDRLARGSVEEHDLRMDWEFDGVEFDEEVKIRAETRRSSSFRTCSAQRHVASWPSPLVGHAEALWVETEAPLLADDAKEGLGEAGGIDSSRPLSSPLDARG